MFAPLFQFNEGYETYSFCPLGNDSLRLQYWDENAYVSELTVSTGEEDAINNADDIQVKTSVDGGATAAEKEGLIATGEEAEAKTRKRKAENKDSSKPKKVRMEHFDWSLMLRTIGRTCSPSILEQPSCRASRCAGQKEGRDRPRE